MKRIVYLLIAFVMFLCCFAGCGSKEPTFMSEKDYQRANANGNPLMSMTLNYKIGEKNIVLVLNYELLMDKCPITVINFMNNVRSHLYDGTVISSYATRPTYLVAGRYTYDKQATKYYTINSDHTIKGEFKDNAYAMPQDGYAEVTLLSLAMHHEKEIAKFDNASTAFVMTLSSTNKIAQNDYAVFAKLVSVGSLTYKSSTEGEQDVVKYQNATVVPSEILDNFKKLSSQKTQTCYTVNADGTETTSTVAMLSNLVEIVSFKLTDKNGAELTDSYFNKLPSGYVISK